MTSNDFTMSAFAVHTPRVLGPSSPESTQRVSARLVCHGLQEIVLSKLHRGHVSCFLTNHDLVERGRMWLTKPPHGDRPMQHLAARAATLSHID